MNISGVEILNETQVVTESAFAWIPFWTVCSIILGIFIVTGIILSITSGPDLEGWMIIIGTGIILGLLFGFISGVMFGTPTKYETHYQVIVNDSVSMNDFLDKYEIVDTEGKIFTVIAKD